MPPLVTVERREREKQNKQILKSFSISIYTGVYLELYCSSIPKLLAFRTPHERGVLVFGVPNAKYLTFGTPNGDDLITYI